MKFQISPTKWSFAKMASIWEFGCFLFFSSAPFAIANALQLLDFSPFSPQVIFWMASSFLSMRIFPRSHNSSICRGIIRFHIAIATWHNPWLIFSKKNFPASPANGWAIAGSCFFFNGMLIERLANVGISCFRKCHFNKMLSIFPWHTHFWPEIWSLWTGYYPPSKPCNQALP